MAKLNPFPTIFKRKSVKRYDLTPLDEDKLDEIVGHLKNLDPMHPDIKTEVKVLPLEEVEVKKKRKWAPHYLVVFSEFKDGYLENIGFMLQQMDLYLSANGVGSCWQGSPRVKETLESSDLEFVIVMAFGNPREDQTLHRDIQEFERKPLSEISTVEGADKWLDAARLAPSSGNVQPWFFGGDKNMIHAYTSREYPKKDYPPEKIKKYNTISTGIALYHLKAAVEHYSGAVEFLSHKKAEKNTPDGYEYTMSIKVE